MTDNEIKPASDNPLLNGVNTMADSAIQKYVPAGIQ